MSRLRRDLQCDNGRASCECGFSVPCRGLVVHLCSRPGLGDMVAAGLASVGVTKERVSAIIGKPCGCPERQEWLNQAGKSIGIGVDKG